MIASRSRREAKERYRTPLDRVIERLGVTGRDLSHDTDIPEAIVSATRTGRWPILPIHYALKIRERYGISLDELYVRKAAAPEGPSAETPERAAAEPAAGADPAGSAEAAA
ncbi:MAG: hypothetical protein A2V88_00760 [Elusimicrobia bacterium RBG_16_66_12]|nr:MAG: hypothetical protein A2V88_00760 [Elusimicrobia bacterium RBG_16_66_12]